MTSTTLYVIAENPRLARELVGLALLHGKSGNYYDEHDDLDKMRRLAATLPNMRVWTVKVHFEVEPFSTNGEKLEG